MGQLTPTSVAASNVVDLDAFQTARQAAAQQVEREISLRLAMQALAMALPIVDVRAHVMAARHGANAEDVARAIPVNAAQLAVRQVVRQAGPKSNVVDLAAVRAALSIPATPLAPPEGPRGEEMAQLASQAMAESDGEARAAMQALALTLPLAHVRAHIIAGHITGRARPDGNSTAIAQAVAYILSTRPTR